MLEEDAKAFAGEWIAAWNGRDLEAVLGHYAEGIVFLTPVGQRVVGNGRVEGIAALRAYWSKALAAVVTPFRFELTSVLVGYECLTILYRNHRGEL